MAPGSGSSLTVSLDGPGCSVQAFVGSDTPVPSPGEFFVEEEPEAHVSPKSHDPPPPGPWRKVTEVGSMPRAHRASERKEKEMGEPFYDGDYIGKSCHPMNTMHPAFYYCYFRRTVYNKDSPFMKYKLYNQLSLVQVFLQRPICYFA